MKKSTNKNNLHILTVNDTGGLTFIKSPANSFDEMTREVVQSNYNEDVISILDKTITRIEAGTRGIYALHGESGTGKSHLLQYIIPKIPIDIKPLYVNVNMISSLFSPHGISALLNNMADEGQSGYALILEDSEVLLRSRETSNNPHISDILNMSDGNMSKFMKIMFFITFNIDLQTIDEALLRPGRLVSKIYVNPLMPEKANKLLEANNISSDVISYDHPVTLAEVYSNINEYIPVLTNKKPHTQKSNHIGFVTA